MTTEQTLEEKFSDLVIKHGPRSPVVHAFMDRHRGDASFLRYAVRLTQLQEYAAFPELLKTRRNHMNDTDEDVLRQLDERMRLYGRSKNNVRSVPEFAACLGENPPKTGDERCYYCGAACGPHNPTKTWVKPTFTDISSVAHPGSNWVCDGCVICLAQDATVTMLDGEVRIDQKMQLYSWVLSGQTGMRAATKSHFAELRRLCLSPPDPPWAISLTEGGRKHFLYRAVLNRSSDGPVAVSLEGEVIRYQRSELSARLMLTTKLAAASGKPALAEPPDVRLAMSVLAYHSDGEALLAEWNLVRSEPLSRLAGWLTPKKEDACLEYPSDLQAVSC